MHITRIYKDTGEVGIFLIHLFLLQTAGRWLFIGLLWLFRLFGMPQLYLMYHQTPHARHWLSTGLLVMAVGVSIARILHKAKRKS